MKNPIKSVRRKLVRRKARKSLERRHGKGPLPQKIGTPKHDGSGKGRRANRGRGGCAKSRKTGKGRR